MANTTITNIHGETIDVTVTMYDRTQAERYAQSHGWEGGMASVVRANSYATYFAAKREGVITIPFDQFLKETESITQIDNDGETPDADNPFANTSEEA